MDNDNIDRDLQRKRKYDEVVRPTIDLELDRDIVDLGKYRDLIETKLPEVEIMKKRKLVI